jgi:hypothetical protein
VAVVGGERVGGGVVGGSVGGTDTVVVGGMMMVVVGGATVVSGGGSVVGVGVWGGGEVVAGVGGEVVPAFRGAVVPTDRWVVAVVPPVPGAGAAVVVLESTVEDVEVDEVLDVDVRATVVLGRAVVDVGCWVATCCRGEVSSPVATSNKSAAMATVARA